MLSKTFGTVDLVTLNKVYELRLVRGSEQTKHGWHNKQEEGRGHEVLLVVGDGTGRRTRCICISHALLHKVCTYANER